MLPTPPCGRQNSARMKHRILPALLIFISTNLALNAQNVTVRATVGTDSADYTTLKGAFDAINLGTHKEVIRLRLKGPTNEGNTTETLNGIYEPGLADMTSKIWFNTGSVAVHYQTNGSCWGNHGCLCITVSVFFTQLYGIIPCFSGSFK